jgi:hypothetical protein
MSHSARKDKPRRFAEHAEAGKLIGNEKYRSTAYLCLLSSG